MSPLFASTELGAVERAFLERAAPVQVELSCLADPSAAPLLSRRGYVLQGFENVLGLGFELLYTRAVLLLAPESS